MFVFILTYKKPLAEVERYLEDHRLFLYKFYKQGKLIASGPRDPRVGGVIVCNAATEDEAKDIIKQDPFYKEDIADYNIVWFHATKYSIPNFEAGLE